MESRKIDLSTVIGVYPLFNTGGVLVHQIDYEGDRVLASINGTAPEWCGMTEQYAEGAEGQEPGFCIGSFFVPFCEVMRI